MAGSSIYLADSTAAEIVDALRYSAKRFRNLSEDVATFPQWEVRKRFVDKAEMLEAIAEDIDNQFLITYQRRTGQL